jgi:hypothetical protein
MKVVWPSAARAHDLFGGVKGAGVSNEPDLISSNNPSERNKRSAEQALDDDSFTNSARPAIDDSPLNYVPPIRQGNQFHQQRLSYDHGNSSMFPTNPSASTPYLAAASMSSPSTMATSTTGHQTTNTTIGYSWQGRNGLNNHFNTPLSTAVLPHFFSTGLMDNGLHAPHTRQGMAHPESEHPRQQQHPSHQAHLSLSSSRGTGNQYQSQFFDNASYSPLGPQAYDVPGSVNVSQPSMYPPQPYSLYSGSLLVFTSLIVLFLTSF